MDYQYVKRIYAVSFPFTHTDTMERSIVADHNSYAKDIVKNKPSMRHQRPGGVKPCFSVSVFYKYMIEYEPGPLSEAISYL